MGGAYSMRDRDKKMHTKFSSWDNEGVHAEDLGVDGKITLEWILGEIEWEDVDWMHLAQYSYQYRALVNTVINFRFHI